MVRRDVVSDSADMLHLKASAIAALVLSTCKVATDVKDGAVKHFACPPRKMLFAVSTVAPSCDIRRAVWPASTSSMARVVVVVYVGVGVVVVGVLRNDYN